MTTSQKTPLLSELQGTAPLSRGALGYLCANTRASYFDYIHQKLAYAEAGGLKRKDIATRIRKTPTRLSHLLGAPGNWTLDTITELLVAISGEEVVPNSLPLLRSRDKNCSTMSILEHNTKPMLKVVFGLPSTAATIPVATYVQA